MICLIKCHGYWEHVVQLLKYVMNMTKYTFLVLINDKTAATSSSVKIYIAMGCIQKRSRRLRSDFSP